MLNFRCVHNQEIMLGKVGLLLIAATVIDFTDADCVPKPRPQVYNFPSKFKWGVATSAFQIEGAAKEDGRGPANWDMYQRKPGRVADNSTADIAADSYHKYREDIQLMKSLGVTHYRFSFSWSRMFPKGVITSPNHKGIQYYHDVIDALIKNGIEPMVTLYHWDLPVALQEIAGWLNREMVDYFRQYAMFCFWEFGDKVKLWITIDEPFSQAAFGYCGIPFKIAPGGIEAHCHWAQYLAGHNMLLAHAHAYRIYHGLFAYQKGKVGLSNGLAWVEPLMKSERDFAKKLRQWTIDWFVHPLFRGDYPPEMRRTVDGKSMAEGRTTSRLPHFTEYEKKMLIGSFDFLGVNYLITLFVRRFRPEEKNAPKTIAYDIDGTFVPNPKDMPVGDKMSWLRSHPAGLREGLNYIRRQYGNPEVFITENGCMDTPGESLNDITRMRYLREHIAAVSQAINDGCNIVGYTVWSLIDNFEWSAGYLRLYGLYKVDFTSPARTRTPKQSAIMYTEIIRNNSVALIEDKLIQLFVS
ncbi:hypothetical protein KIN20_007998 [Parelaphostrongylus tenuis]|uniref:Cytosolic beta-glucosidase n=1 Tax=Parelaphostrongylus tenuis TaxID=148309 RepID=A0AAD5MQI2_PARTN|nr:hypothetical protein KIN20_007998 [Parelaphostrongylus tenuis]